MMEVVKTKRDLWVDNDVKVLLEVIREKHIEDILDNKTKRNKTIYSSLEKELQNRNIFKSSDQIRNKFKCLKTDYYKVKRNNNTSSAKKHTCMHYAILDEMFGHRPMVTTAIDETPVLEETPSDSQRKKFAKKRSYEKMMQSYTSQWKATQEETIKKLIERDERNWAKLEEHRRETERMLEKDRQETAQMFQNILQMTPFSPYHNNSISSISSISSPCWSNSSTPPRNSPKSFAMNIKTSPKSTSSSSP